MTQTLDLVEAMYQSVADPTRWANTLDKVAEACGGCGMVVLPFDDTERHRPTWSKSLDEATMRYQADGWWRMDSRIIRGRSRRVRGITSDFDILSADEIKKDKFYNEFLKDYQLGYCLANIVEMPDGQVVTFSVQREAKSGFFTEDEFTTLRHLGGHLKNALWAAESLQNLQEQADAEVAARRGKADGYFVLDHDGRLLLADRVAEAMIGSLVLVRCGRLVPAEDRGRERFLHAVSRCGSSRVSQTARVVGLSRHSDRIDVLLQIMPLRGSIEIPGTQSGRIVVLVHDLSIRTTSGVASLLQTMGLSEGQVRVAIEIADGRTVVEAARDLGLSEHTVKSVMKTVYEKLGFSKQTQLASLVTRLTLVGRPDP